MKSSRLSHSLGLHKDPKAISEFQNEVKRKTFLVKKRYICIRTKNHFHVSGLTLGLTLKQRLGATLKWPIGYSSDHWRKKNNDRLM